MSKETGGPAFPGLHPSAELRHKDEGMTLRDYFAAKAMGARKWTIYMGTRETNESLAADAQACYQIADAMIKERNK